MLKSGKGGGLFVMMGEIKSLVCGWSWEENKLFELALAVVDERDPNRWEAVAAIVGGKKSAEEVQRQYVFLLEDLQFIEGGFMDSELEMEDAHNHKSNILHAVDCPQSLYWNDEDHKISLLSFSPARRCL